MPDYRRSRVPGGTCFFTLALADRRGDLLVREIDALRAAVTRTRRLHPFRIDAWVVLPEHLRAVWTLPEGDAAYARRWALMKRWFSAAVPPGEDRSASRAAKGERGLWQRRFWEHTVRDAEDFARHVDDVCSSRSGTARGRRVLAPQSRQGGFVPLLMCGRREAVRYSRHSGTPSAKP